MFTHIFMAINNQLWVLVYWPIISYLQNWLISAITINLTDYRCNTIADKTHFYPTVVTKKQCNCFAQFSFQQFPLHVIVVTQ